MSFRVIGLSSGVFIPLFLVLFADFGGSPQVVRMAAIALMMSIFWITEAIPLAATALIPLALFPLMGITDAKQVAMQYMNSTVFLLIGGFLIALSMQRWNLHKRIALAVLALFGSKPTSVILGFMVTSAGLSMWISNTATTLMMLPIALAVISRFEQLLKPQDAHRFTVGLLLSIAYSASVGGMMTLVGTAPNLVFAQLYETFAGDSIGFAQWMMLTIPIAVAILSVLAVLVCVFYIKKTPIEVDLRSVIVEERKKLGGMLYEEKAVLLVFICTAILWISRKGLKIGEWELHGWSDLLNNGNMINDGSVAIFMALILFFIPARLNNGEKTTILTDDVFNLLPWPIVLLFGGGFALAYGFTESGLSIYLASQLNNLESAGVPFIMFIVTLSMSMLTELTSNTASTQMVLPVLQTAAEVLSVNPVVLMFPATLAASCAFMFPVATPPNAIIFGSGRVKMIEMISAGIVLNAVAILFISVLSYYLLPLVEL